MSDEKKPVTETYISECPYCLRMIVTEMTLKSYDKDCNKGWYAPGLHAELEFTCKSHGKVTLRVETRTGEVRGGFGNNLTVFGRNST